MIQATQEMKRSILVLTAATLHSRGAQGRGERSSSPKRVRPVNSEARRKEAGKWVPGTKEESRRRSGTNWVPTEIGGNTDARLVENWICLSSVATTQMGGFSR